MHFFGSMPGEELKQNDFEELYVCDCPSGCAYTKCYCYSTAQGHCFTTPKKLFAEYELVGNENTVATLTNNIAPTFPAVIGSSTSADSEDPRA